jgi:hypothetical protein
MGAPGLSSTGRGAVTADLAEAALAGRECGVPRAEFGRELALEEESPFLPSALSAPPPVPLPSWVAAEEEEAALAAAAEEEEEEEEEV